MKRNLRSHISIIRSTRNTRSTKRSTKSITLPSLKSAKVRKRGRALKRGSQARIEATGDNIIGVKESLFLPRPAKCFLLLLLPNLKERMGILPANIMEALATNRVEMTTIEVMNIEVGFNLPTNSRASIQNLTMKRASIVTTITLLEVGVRDPTLIVEGQAVETLINSSNNRLSSQKSSADSPISVSILVSLILIL
jgi:hypothetical protein